MAHLRARSITVDLGGGAEVQLRATPALEALVAEVSVKGAASGDSDEAGWRVFGALMARWPAIVDSGALTSWSGVTDDAGDEVPFGPDVALDLDVACKQAVLMTMLTWLFRGPLRDAAEEIGFEDPTPPAPGQPSGDGSGPG